MIPRAGTDQRTAIVGSGPAGLSCAWFLARLGRRSVVCEAKSEPGGLLATGIPPFRLSRDILRERIDGIIGDHVHLSLMTEVFDPGELFERGFETVFLATGAQRGRTLDIPGESLPGVVDALEYLASYCLGDGTVSARGHDVVVVGGGHTAFDAARAAVRDGAQTVTVCYRRGMDEFSAYTDEIEAAMVDGVSILTRSVPAAICGSGRTGVLRVERTDGIDDLRCTLLIRAIGQTLPDLPVYAAFPRFPWDGLKVDLESGASDWRGVFAGGDCVLGASSVLRAIDAGKRSAIAIDRYLGGPGSLPPEADFSIPRPFGLFNP